MKQRLSCFALALAVVFLLPASVPTVLAGSQSPVSYSLGSLADWYPNAHAALTNLRAVIDLNYSYAFSRSSDGQVIDVVTNGPVADFSDVVSLYGTHVDVQHGVVALSSGRLADTPPFWGGAAINDGTSLCTSGWVAKNNGSNEMVTAGHCFPKGATVYANRYAGQGYVEGTVTNRDFPAFDAEIYLGASMAPTIYNGVDGDNFADISIFGRQKAEVSGPIYCRTGQTSGKSCGWWLQDTDATFCSSDGCTNHVNSYGGGQSPLGGDSGGPIYVPYNGGALISGTIIGYTCFVFCSYFGQPIQSVLTRWNTIQVCSGTCVIGHL